MDENESIAVDFVFPVESEPTIEQPVQTVKSERLGKCTGCGHENYILASQLGGDVSRGIPASRMFECSACGTYRLG
jgi:hypothetical protein